MKSTEIEKLLIGKLEKLKEYEVYSEDSLICIFKNRHLIGHSILWQLPLSIIENYIENNTPIDPNTEVLINTLMTSLNGSISSTVADKSLDTVSQIITIFYDLKIWFNNILDKQHKANFKNIESSKLKNKYLCRLIQILSDENVVTNNRERLKEAIYQLTGSTDSTIDQYLKPDSLLDDDAKESRDKTKAINTLEKVMLKFKKYERKP